MHTFLAAARKNFECFDDVKKLWLAITFKISNVRFPSIDNLAALCNVIFTLHTV